jgi:hypothetical protein
MGELCFLSFTGNIQYVSGFLMNGLKTPGQAFKSTAANYH